MTYECRPKVGDVIYIIGKYSFSKTENYHVIKTKVAFIKNNDRYYSYARLNSGLFSFNINDFGKCVFCNREDAENALCHIVDTIALLLQLPY